MDNTDGTNYLEGLCPICGLPYIYIGDVPTNGLKGLICMCKEPDTNEYKYCPHCGEKLK